MTESAREPIVAPAVFWVLAASVAVLVLVAYSPQCDSGNDAAGKGLAKAFGEALKLAGLGFVGILAILFAIIKQRVVRAILTSLLCIPLPFLILAVTDQIALCSSMAKPFPPETTGAIQRPEPRLVDSSAVAVAVATR